MKTLFRSRLPSELTLSQTKNLSNQSNLSSDEIQEYYKRFTVCYPYGYVSFKEFIIYVKQLYIYKRNSHHQLSKSFIKQLFRTFDLTKDKQLNFEEFFRFNLSINHGSNENKLKFIFNLYHQEQKKYYTQQQIIIILIDLLDLLDIPKSIDSFSRTIDRILCQLNLKNQSNKINWNTFCTSILNHSSSLELLLFNNENLEEILVTRL